MIYSSIGEDLSKTGEKQWIFSNWLSEIIISQTIIMIFIHFFQSYFHQFFDTFIRIFITRLLDQWRIRNEFFFSNEWSMIYFENTTLQQLKDFFSWNMFFTFQWVAIESNWKQNNASNWLKKKRHELTDDFLIESAT